MKLDQKSVSAAEELEKLLTNHFRKNRNGDTDNETLQLEVLPHLAQRTNYRTAKSFLDNPELFSKIARKAFVASLLLENQSQTIEIS